MAEVMGSLLNAIVHVGSPQYQHRHVSCAVLCGFKETLRVKYPNPRYRHEAMIGVPNTETLHTPYLGTLDP